MGNVGDGIKKKTRFFTLVRIFSNVLKPNKLLDHVISWSSIRFDLMITYCYINWCYLLSLLWLFHNINLFYYNLKYVNLLTLMTCVVYSQKYLCPSLVTFSSKSDGEWFIFFILPRSANACLLENNKNGDHSFRHTQ